MPTSDLDDSAWSYSDPHCNVETAGCSPGCTDNWQCACGEACQDGICVYQGPPECCFDADCTCGAYCDNGECVSEDAACCDVVCPGDGSCTDGSCVYQLSECRVGLSQDEVVLAGDPSSLVLADLDGDGDRDIAVAEPDEGRVELTFNDGAGQFAAGTFVLLDAPAVTMHLITGDLDGDGDVDIVVDSTAPYKLFVLVGEGGVFTLTSSVPIDVPARGAAIGHIDGDMLSDFVGVDLVERSIVVWHGDGIGGLVAGPSFPDLSTSAWPAVVDLDGDIFLDVVGQPVPDTTVLTVAHGDGMGGFIPDPSLSAVGVVSRVHAVDIDGSGELDIIASRSDWHGGVQGWLRQGGAWVYPDLSHQYFDLRGGGFGDVDGDQELDFVSAMGSASVALLLGDGAGRFECGTLVAVPTVASKPELLAVGDVTGDGRADIVVAAPGVAAVLSAR